LTSIRSEQAVAFFTNIIHRFEVPNSIITDNGTQFTGKKFLDFCDDHHIHVDWAAVAHPMMNGQVERANGMIFAGAQTKDLQRPQQVRQAMDEGTTLGCLESEDDAKPSHGLFAVLSSLWGRGYLAHRLRIRFPEDEGVR
jgi:transposase InsO family protein